MNHVSLIGRVAREVSIFQPETSAHAITHNAIAVSKIYKNAEGQTTTEFIPFVAFDRLAERIERYVQKGDRIAIEGRISMRNSKKHDYKEPPQFEVIVEEVFFLEPKSSHENQGASTDDLEAIFTS